MTCRFDDENLQMKIGDCHSATVSIEIETSIK